MLVLTYPEVVLLLSAFPPGVAMCSRYTSVNHLIFPRSYLPHVLIHYIHMSSLVFPIFYSPAICIYFYPRFLIVDVLLVMVTSGDGGGGGIQI